LKIGLEEIDLRNFSGEPRSKLASSEPDLRRPLIVFNSRAVPLGRRSAYVGGNIDDRDPMFRAYRYPEFGTVPCKRWIMWLTSNDYTARQPFLSLCHSLGLGVLPRTFQLVVSMKIDIAGARPSSRINVCYPAKAHPWMSIAP